MSESKANNTEYLTVSVSAFGSEYCEKRPTKSPSALIVELIQNVPAIFHDK